VVIRYPRDPVCGDVPAPVACPLLPGKAEILRRGRRVALFAYGAMVKEALAAAESLGGEQATVVDARFAKPVDADMLRELAREHELLVTIEDHALAGGFGSAVLETLADEAIQFRQVVRLGIPDRFVRGGPRLRRQGRALRSARRARGDRTRADRPGHRPGRRLRDRRG